MKSNTYFISTPKTALVVTSGNSRGQNIWMILHGYGQLAEEFQKNFDGIDEAENYFVFPNALNHFYLKMGRDNVGASWMTRYYRENDIQDNIHYLDKVFSEFIMPVMNEKKNLYLLGFSQGAATLVRWLASNNIQPTKIILWGAVFPPDVSKEAELLKLKNFEWLYFIGTEDEYIDNAEKQKQKEFFEHHQFNLKWIEYQGKHQLSSEVLMNYLS